MSDDELAIAPAPYLVTRRWVKERYMRWAPNHPMYRARVLGEFPEQSELSVYSLAWIEAASREPAAQPNEGKVRLFQIGIDVAGPGEDESVLVARVGEVIIAQQAWSDPPRSIGCSAWHMSTLAQVAHYRLGPVVVDAVGVGYRIATHLADHGFEVYAPNAGGAPIDAEHFVSAKAEAYWSRASHWSAAQSQGLTDEEMQAQLAGIRYRHTPSGRVESRARRTESRTHSVLANSQPQPRRGGTLNIPIPPVFRRNDSAGGF